MLPRASVAALVAIVVFPASAVADFDTIFNDFKADGRLEDPCRYSPGELQEAEGQIPPDVEQYAPSFGESIRAARDRHVRGGCAAGATSQGPSGEKDEPGAAAAAPADEPPAAADAQGVTAPPAPKVKPEERFRNIPSPEIAARSAKVGNDPPGPVWLLALAAALAGAGALAMLVMRFFGWSAERWTRPFAVAAADAGGRSADLAAGVRDRLRLRA